MTACPRAFICWWYSAGALPFMSFSHRVTCIFTCSRTYSVAIFLPCFCHACLATSSHRSAAGAGAANTPQATTVSAKANHDGRRMIGLTRM